MDLIARLQSIVNTPLAVTDAYAETLSTLIEANKITAPAPYDYQASIAQASIRSDAEYERTGSRIAIIPIHSTTAHRGDWFDIGYDEIKQAVGACVLDEQIQGIMLDFSTPGGEVSGLHDFSKWLNAASQHKPIWSISNELCASAGYYQAAATNRIIAPESARVGSIGVVITHVDMSKMYEEIGIKVTMIAKGKHKTTGNSFESLSDEDYASIEASLEAPYTRFVESVAGYRDMDVEVIKNTEAAVFDSKTALQVGLIDEVMSADDALMEFSEHLSSSNKTTSLGDIGLKLQGKETGKEVEAPAGTVKTYEEGLEDGRAEGAATEQTRVLAILDSPEAQGREKTARKLVVRGESSESAIDFLTDIPRAVSTPADDTDELDASLSTDKNVAKANQVRGDIDADSKSDEKPESWGERKAKATASMSGIVSINSGAKA